MFPLSAWLSRLFPTPRTPADLAADIDRLLEAQLASADRYDESGRYPSHVTRAIRSAAGAAAAAARRILTENPYAPPKDLSGAILAARTGWLDLHEDEDGYGSATFHELARSVAALSRR